MAARQEQKRENYKPSGAIVLTPKGCKAEIYLFDDKNGRPCAVGFKGRAKKPSFRHWFEQPARRERFVARFIKETTEQQKRSSQRTDQHTLKVDDVLVASWGYDQTNIQFFQVVKDAGKNTVHLREIKSKSALREGENRLAMQDKVVPVVGAFKTGVLKKRVDMSGGNPSVKVGYGAIAWLWDGKPQTQTSYACGLGMNQLAKQFVETINNIDQSKHRDEVFRDFCNMAYCALAKPCQPNVKERDRLEAQYMEVVKRYRNKDDIRENMPKLLSLTVLGLSNGNCDFLGEVAGELGVLDAKLGQFFTPYHISKMMAKINLVGAKEHIEQKGYLTVHEPAVGAGGMLLAVADVVEDMGVKLETSLWIDAVELSVSTFHMAYVQLAARGIAGVVRRGNSLSHEMFESVFLPATPHFLAAHPTFLDDQQAIAEKHAQAKEFQNPSKPVQTELVF